MNKWLEKGERIVDKLIPAMLVLLLAIIIIEIFFKDIADHYETLLSIGDKIVVSVFVVDLAFKFNRTRKIPKFIRKYWLDIIAVFPFFLMFRLFEGIIFSQAFLEGGSQLQSILHEGLAVEKEGSKIAEVIEKEGAKIVQETGRVASQAGKVSRAARFTRFLRVITRAPRFVKAVPFYMKPAKKKK